VPNPRAHHGVRVAYQAGCRCLACRVANSRYRAVPLVSAAAAACYLRMLAAGGVGHARAAELSGLAESQLRRIRSGAVTRIRQATHDQVVGIPLRPALGARISAVEARRKIRQMLAERLTKAQIARETGHRTPRLQLGRTAVTVRTALKVRQLHRRMMSVGGDQIAAIATVATA
jgi:hypothetical protein